MSTHSQDGSRETDARVERLEESHGYSERTIEVLSGEIAEINKVVSLLVHRLSRLEHRLSELNDRVSDDPGNVPPPHSAGPDIPRDPL